ncbi:MAG: nitroreductase family protein [Desulfovibrio sp.]
MDLLQAIHERRSVRKYTNEPVSDEIVRELLGAAMMAPSAGNAQPWQYVVIRDRKALESVQSFSPHAGMAAHAPLGILVCGDLSLEKYPGYWVQDCSAAVQNLLLTVHAKGLGAVWTGVHTRPEREEGFRKLCNLPENIMPLAFLVIGVPDQQPRSEDRYKAERVHLDQFGTPW